MRAPTLSTHAEIKGVKPLAKIKSLTSCFQNDNLGKKEKKPSGDVLKRRVGVSCSGSGSAGRFVSLGFERKGRNAEVVVSGVTS